MRKNGSIWINEKQTLLLEKEISYLRLLERTNPPLNSPINLMLASNWSAVGNPSYLPICLQYFDKKASEKKQEFEVEAANWRKDGELTIDMGWLIKQLRILDLKWIIDYKAWKNYSNGHIPVWFDWFIRIHFCHQDVQITITQTEIDTKECDRSNPL